MKVMLIIVILVMTISGCKISYQKSHVEAGSIAGTGIFLNAKVCLESAFIDNVPDLEMKTTLYLPADSPYNIDPWWHTSYNDYSIDANMIDPDADPLTSIDRFFVDWVVVQVFQNINGDMTFMDSQSGVIQFDGTIYDTSGLPGILFPELEAGNYYINIIHRNHLSIGTQNPVALTADEVVLGDFDIDFTNAATAYLDEGTLVPVPYKMKDVTTKCLKAGDLNGDLSIDTDDQDIIEDNIAAIVFAPALDAAILGYRNSDLDFDGMSQMYTDLASTPSPDLLFITPNLTTQGSIHGD